jgi:hypothetical protein
VALRLICALQPGAHLHSKDAIGKVLRIQNNKVAGATIPLVVGSFNEDEGYFPDSFWAGGYENGNVNIFNSVFESHRVNVLSSLY